MQGEIGQQLQHFQETVSKLRLSIPMHEIHDILQLYSGKISDETTAGIATYFYDLPTSSLRRNQYIFPASGALQVVDLPDLFRRSGFRVAPSTFVYPRT
jgi:UDP-glucose:glycoprotein glucosyltransferase